MQRPQAKVNWPGSWYEHSSVYSQEEENESGWSPLEGCPPRPLSAALESTHHLENHVPSEYSLQQYSSSEDITALPALPVEEPPSKEANNYITGWKLALLLLR